MSSINFQRPLGYRTKNLNKINERIDALLADYAKILVIRVDFYIRKNHILDIDHSFMVRALTRLRNNCNDPAVSAQLKLLKHTPQQGFSSLKPDAVAHGYRIETSDPRLAWQY